MEAKDKAKELIDKFISYSYFSDGNNSMNRAYEQEDNAKQCALIAVDEILDSNMIHLHLHQMDYWEEVKQEIINL